MTARKKNSLYQQVRRAYSQDALTRILTLPETEFGREFGMQTTEVEQQGSFWSWDAKTKKGTKHTASRDYYHFRDNGARVLAVAHLDTVVGAKGREPHFSTTKSGPAVVSGALDDRLGAYVILKLLPELGISCDWLLTVGEEDGQSTASFFTSKKSYDHVIEFDRAGTDVVMYQYEDPDTRKAVRASGATVGNGSFSDICYLEQLDTKAFNWGVGYRGNYHSEKGYAFLTDTFTMTARYLRFHAQNSGTIMPHEPAVQRYGHGILEYRGGSSYHNESDCDMCGAFATVDMDTLICAICRSCSECGRDELSHRAGCLATLNGQAADDAAYEKWLAQRAMSAELTAKTAGRASAAAYDKWEAETAPAEASRPALAITAPGEITVAELPASSEMAS
jgi:hypothetical protein